MTAFFEGYDRIQTHARSILEGEGQEEHDPTLVKAVARAIASAIGAQGHPVTIGAARAALSTIRKHQAGE